MAAKLAVTCLVALIMTTQAPLPVQPAPLQPVNVEPVAGLAVSVTGIPLVKLLLQTLPQLMPAGALVTVPLPTLIIARL
ncbi:hypothetical protein CXB77_16750 [Chromatium okenii]|uniref:Uncharacterized protein n=1 Tax=Chromatium okenii TaxID=61644 RepID=A0A2S7XQX2_9GAMM|nr:hypothetical protein CXB77_16750 [Chromatium okenii]